MSLGSDLFRQAKQWRRLADEATDPATKQALTDLANDYEATAVLHGNSATYCDHAPVERSGDEKPSCERDVPIDVDEAAVWELRSRLVEDLRAIALPIVTSNPTGSAALMALAEVAGDVIAAVATSNAHLEEGLRIFARLTREQAVSRPLGRKSFDSKG